MIYFDKIIFYFQETSILHTNAPYQDSLMFDGMHSTSLDRIVNRNNNSRIIHDDNRYLKKSDSTECLQGKLIHCYNITWSFILDSSPKVSRLLP